MLSKGQCHLEHLLVWDINVIYVFCLYKRKLGVCKFEHNLNRRHKSRPSRNEHHNAYMFGDIGSRGYWIRTQISVRRIFENSFENFRHDERNHRCSGDYFVGTN